jgi:hypothetical protein
MFWRKPKSNLDPDDEAWLLECWGWLDGHFGTVDRPGHGGLILPSRSAFPDTPLQGHARALHYLEHTKAHFRLTELPVDLVAQAPTRKLPTSVVFGEMKSSGALGTFSPSGNAIRITYDSALLGNPMQLIATLAHELAHYVLATATEDPPGGQDAVEFATDLVTAHFGFGLFGANTAYNFNGYTDFDRQGWQAQRSGYLTENEWSFVLAIFAEVRGLDGDDMKSYAKDHIVTSIRKNRAYLKAHPELIQGFRQSSS